MKICLGVYGDFNGDGRMGINEDFYKNFNMRDRMVIYGNICLVVNGKVNFIKRIGICVDGDVGDDANRHEGI